MVFGIWGEGKIIVIIFLQVAFNGGIIRHFFCYDTSSTSCISELVLSFDVVFKSLCSRMRFVAEVITTSGGLPGYLGASCSGSLCVHASGSERWEEVAN
jgi:hypothetical protein